MPELAHIALSVNQIETSAMFYKKLLDVKSKLSLNNNGMSILVLDADGFDIELFSFDDCKSLPDYRHELNTDLRTIGTKHFAIKSFDIEKDYHHAISVCNQYNIEPYSDIKIFENGMRYFFIKDPDGNFIEYMEYKT